MIGQFRAALMRLATATAATLGFLQAYLLPVGWNVGPRGRYWERLRRVASRHGGWLVDDRAGPRPVASGEYAGHAAEPLAAVEATLWNAGFLRNPFSRLKIRNGQADVGSWAYRETPLASRQLHVMLFDGEGGGIDIYAHDELSSVHPFVGAAHFDGAGQDVATGVSRARSMLELDTSDATVEPAAAPWHAQPE